MSFWTVTGTQKTLKRRFLRRSLPTLTPSRETGLATKSHLPLTACQWRGPITVIITPWDAAFWLHSMNIEQGCRTSIPWPPWLWLVRCSPHSHWGKTTELEAKLQGTEHLSNSKLYFVQVAQWKRNAVMRERKKEGYFATYDHKHLRRDPSHNWNCGIYFPRCFGRAGTGHGNVPKTYFVFNHGNTFFSEMLGEGGEGSADLANYDKEAPVLHVLVVGFHHKKGCQVFTL